MIEKVGFSGGCHWCTEAVFQHLHGVEEVHQGWMAGRKHPEDFTEGVQVFFQANVVPLKTLVNIHIDTHSAYYHHKKRTTYRSGIYVFTQSQLVQCEDILHKLAKSGRKPLTNVYFFDAFRLNQPRYLNYYKSDPDKPFCQRYIEPKLQLLKQKYQPVFKPFKS